MAKTFSILTILLLASLNVSAAPEAQSPAEKPIRTTLQLVACPPPDDEVSVYSKDNKRVATLEANELVNRFQGWGENEIITGSLKLVRVQIPSRTELGEVFVNESLITTAEACSARTIPKLAYLPVPADTGVVVEDDDDEEDASDAPVLDAAAPQEVAVFNIDADACCKFPLATRPKSFLSGIARFGAGRKKGRSHGGADLYGTRGQAVFAVAPGTVVRAPYLFKSGTLAIDVRHRGGFVVRYGEISGKSFGLKVGSTVTEGQQLGEMKYVPGAPAAMTHFELYRGNASGKLSQPGNNSYSRRGDIMNPTTYLVNWGKK